MNDNVIKINENGEIMGLRGDNYRIDINDNVPAIQMYKNEYEWMAMYINDFKCSIGGTQITFKFFKRAVEHWLGDGYIYDAAEGWFENLYQRWINLTVISIGEDGKFKFKGNEYRIDILQNVKYDDHLLLMLYKDNIPSAFVSSSKLKEDEFPTEEYGHFKEILNYFIEDVWFYRQVLEIRASEEWYRKMYSKWTGCVPYSSRLTIKPNWNK